ncbi:MAG: hypothetical protein KBS81_05200 [Spirochaetales bacterium]|nr:hypothetical protein [Candidatus Physcosoma equi]
MRRKEKDREEFEDDGRSFADMNVEGLPWYRPKQRTDAAKGDTPELTPEESKYFLWGVLKAALLIAGIFAGVFFLFILFLDVVVFKN